MNITFLIGNGFDRALGLETGYNAFYEWYCNQPKNNLEEWVVSFRKEIDKYIHKEPDAEAYWSDAEYGLGKYTEKFSLDTVDQFIDCFEDFRDNLVEYLKQQDALVTKELAEKIKPHIAPQLTQFFQEIDPLDVGAVRDTVYKDGASTSKLNVVCFNYTNAIDKIVMALKKEHIGDWRGSDGAIHKLIMGDLVHAHGTLNRWPIIGVCNTNTVENKELWNSDLFKAVMQKNEGITVAGQVWRHQTDAVIKNSQIICVFGMSIGETDSDYWELLSDWLEGDSRRQLVVFWYDTKFKKLNLSVNEKYREVVSVREKLLNYSSWTNETFKKMKQRIHIVLKPSKMFSIPEDCKVSTK